MQTKALYFQKKSLKLSTLLGECDDQENCECDATYLFKQPHDFKCFFTRTLLA